MCEKYMYNRDGTPMLRNDQDFVPVHLERVPGTKTPCGECPRIPATAPIPPKLRTIEVGRRYELSPRNRRTLRHYLECRAVGSFPDDPIVRRNAALLRETEDAFAQGQQRQLVQVLMVGLKLKEM